jgi:AcrR family transcriptional regulator
MTTVKSIHGMRSRCRTPLEHYSRPMDLGAVSKGEMTLRRLIDEAIRQFGDRGYQQTTLASVARSTGLTPAALYPYFATKHAMFLAAAEADLGSWCHGAREASRNSTTPWLTLLATMLARVHQHHLVVRVIRSESPELLAEVIALPPIVELRAQLTGELDTAARLGLLAPSLVVAPTVDALLRVAIGLVFLDVRTGPPKSDAFMTALGAILGNGIIRQDPPKRGNAAHSKARTASGPSVSRGRAARR